MFFPTTKECHIVKTSSGSFLIWSYLHLYDVSIYIYTCIHTYVTLRYVTLTDILTYWHTDIHTYVRTYVHTYIHMYICIFIFIFIYLYIYPRCISIALRQPFRSMAPAAGSFGHPLGGSKSTGSRSTAARSSDSGAQKWIPQSSCSSYWIIVWTCLILGLLVFLLSTTYLFLSFWLATLKLILGYKGGS